MQARSYLVVEVEGGQPRRVVDGVLPEHGLQVGHVNRPRAVAHHGHHARRQRVTELVEHRQEYGLAAGAVAGDGRRKTGVNSRLQAGLPILIYFSWTECLFLKIHG